MSCECKNEEIEAYRNSIRFCIKGIENPHVLKDISNYVQNIWHYEKKHEKNQAHHVENGG